MSGIRFRWLSLTTYIKMISNLHELQRQLGKSFDWSTGSAWVVHLRSNDLSVKTADIVIFDRRNKK